MERIQSYKTEIYFYNTLEERKEHCRVMKLNGWVDDERIKYDKNQSLNNPDYVWYGCYRRSY